MREAQVETCRPMNISMPSSPRALKDGARPLAQEPGAVLCPADGAISQLGPIEHGRIFQAKGHSYSLAELLGGDAELAAPFMGGDFATVYLSPGTTTACTCRWPAPCARWSTFPAGCSR